MQFRLRRDARKWFKNIEHAFSWDFDMYYLCLMAGLAAGRKDDVTSSETTELVDNFPQEYRSQGRIILALFLSRELRAMGIKLTERATIHSAIHRLVEPRSASHLSDVGMKEINRYSFGGFEVLTEWFHDQPRTLETFLPRYKQRLDRALHSAHW